MACLDIIIVRGRRGDRELKDFIVYSSRRYAPRTIIGGCP
jgi:hypothetical protein